MSLSTVTHILLSCLQKHFHYVRLSLFLKIDAIYLIYSHIPFGRFSMRKTMILKGIEATRSSEALVAAHRRLTSLCRNTWTGARCAALCNAALYSIPLHFALFLQPFFTLPFRPLPLRTPSSSYFPLSFIFRHLSINESEADEQDEGLFF